MSLKQALTPQKIIAAILLITAIGIGTHLSITIYDKSTEEEKNLAISTQIKEKLIFLKDLQVAYHQKYGRYANDWSTLKVFIDNDNFYLTQTKESVITLDYGADSTITKTDTLEIVSVRDSLISRGKYPKLETKELSRIPNSKLDFKLEAVDNGYADMFVIKDIDPKSPKILIDEIGRVNLEIGSIERPTTKGNWEK